MSKPDKIIKFRNMITREIQREVPKSPSEVKLESVGKKLISVIKEQHSQNKK